jgi:hypothetical protein
MVVFEVVAGREPEFAYGRWLAGLMYDMCRLEK